MLHSVTEAYLYESNAAWTYRKVAGVQVPPWLLPAARGGGNSCCWVVYEPCAGDDAGGFCAAEDEFEEGKTNVERTKESCLTARTRYYGLSCEGGVAASWTECVLPYFDIRTEALAPKTGRRRQLASPCSQIAKIDPDQDRDVSSPPTRALAHAPNLASPSQRTGLRHRPPPSTGFKHTTSARPYPFVSTTRCCSALIRGMAHINPRQITAVHARVL